jgi:hypothetical protein
VHTLIVCLVQKNWRMFSVAPSLFLCSQSGFLWICLPFLTSTNEVHRSLLQAVEQVLNTGMVIFLSACPYHSNGYVSMTYIYACALLFVI